MDLKGIVFEAIKKKVLPIHVIAKAAGLSTQTTSKYCHILQAEQRVRIERFGNMKMVKKK